MDFFNSLALPQSHEHLILLKYLLGLTFTLFVPYLTILIGASLYSIILKKKSSKSGDSRYLNIARDLVNIATFNKSVVFALGIIPLISAIFCYIQLLQYSSASSVSFLIAGFVSFVLGIILMFSYKNSFNLKTVLDSVDKKQIEFDEKDTNEVLEIYRTEAGKRFQKNDLWSLILFLITAWLFASAIENAADLSLWGSDTSIIATLFSIRTISYVFYLVILALALSPVAVLFYYYKIRDEKEYAPEFINLVREYSITKGLVFVIILPVFVLLQLVFTPESALAYNIFLLNLLLIASLLLIATFFYVMMKDKKSNYITTLVVLSFLLFVFNNAKDQAAFSSTSKKQLAKLEAKFAKYEEEFKSSLGLQTAVISGEDIYNGKCIACHQFDRKLVGPPYNEVLPKYVNNKDALVQFILNPQKINPAYPAMPNQGLKPNEARAVAEYILSTYQK